MTDTMTENQDGTTSPEEPRPTIAPVAPEVEEAGLVESEFLIEDVSIDGMCGVY
jgi:mycofactocin precursor